MPDDVLAELTSAAAEKQWTGRWLEAITTPPTSRHRVHVAVDEPGKTSVTGFAAAGPATDGDLWPATDAELYELHVLPDVTGQGHGGRLLNAVADTFAEDGFRTGVHVGAVGRRRAAGVPRGGRLGAGRQPQQPGHGRESARGPAAHPAVA